LELAGRAFKALRIGGDALGGVVATGALGACGMALVAAEMAGIAIVAASLA